ncbi:MAG: hypothetical protein IKS03_09280 [Ruminococcus sp.]|nr:hypothetical protein [Ruminococcus sp.]
MTDRLKKSSIYAIFSFVTTMALFIFTDWVSALCKGESFNYSAVWHLSFPAACALIDFLIIYFKHDKSSEKEFMGIKYN